LKSSFRRLALRTPLSTPLSSVFRQVRVPRVLVIATQFSSAKLLRLLSGDHLVQPAAEIEKLHVEYEPRIVPGDKAP